MQDENFIHNQKEILKIKNTIIGVKNAFEYAHQET